MIPENRGPRRTASPSKRQKTMRDCGLQTVTSDTSRSVKTKLSSSVEFSASISWLDNFTSSELSRDRRTGGVPLGSVLQYRTAHPPKETAVPQEQALTTREQVSERRPEGGVCSLEKMDWTRT